jgi:hypothetical protein
MWFVARDLAFEHPVTPDQTAQLLKRMGIDTAPKSDAELADLRRAQIVARALPDDIDYTLEMVVSRMIGLLLIEISAFHGFRWAEAVLSDTELVAGDGEAARVVSFIRSDETPHVAWLQTALSELRDRTWVGEGGRRHAGSDMIGTLWDRALADSLLLRRQTNLELQMREIERALEGRRDRDDLLAEVLALGTVRRLDDGHVVDAAGDHVLG